MKFKSASIVAGVLLLGLSTSVLSQFAVDEPEWKESDTPPPPAFDMGKLISLDVSPNSSLTYGVDPASISLTKSDGVVRYVMVATSASGARNVMYEGIRCSTGEFKTYARYSADGKWSLVTDPQWRSMFGNMPSKHPLRLAKAGACDNAAPASSVKEMVSRLKNPNSRVTP
ncbi:CNP1-like family protein [Polaromonas glacialis]|uniref:CNP1-like family protein n=1 Tax=Polaromonas glacialis TaxID=866564 RepID=UPI0004970F80|nr:CNP1-like family protein [Polaromonas glacialis]